MSAAELIDANAIFGPLLIGSFANAMLFSLEIAQFIRFFSAKRGDPVLLKLLLLALFLIDLVAVASGIVSIYYLLVREWGNPFGLFGEGWSLSIYVVTTSLGGFLAQLYLISRVWRLTKSYWASVPLVVCALLALGAGLSLAGLTWLTVQTPAMTTRITIWTAAACATDIFISIVSLVVLYKARQHAKRFEQSRLKGPITRLMIRTVETGTITSALALAALATYLVKPDSTAAEAIVYPLGRIYTLTVYFCIFATVGGRDGDAGSGAHDGGGRSFADDTATINRARREKAISSTGAGSGSGERQPSPVTAITVQFETAVCIEDEKGPLQLTRGATSSSRATGTDSWPSTPTAV